MIDTRTPRTILIAGTATILAFIAGLSYDDTVVTTDGQLHRALDSLANDIYEHDLHLNHQQVMHLVSVDTRTTDIKTINPSDFQFGGRFEYTGENLTGIYRDHPNGTRTYIEMDGSGKILKRVVIHDDPGHTVKMFLVDGDGPVSPSPPSQPVWYLDLPAAPVPLAWEQNSTASLGGLGTPHHYHVNPKDCRLAISQVTDGTDSTHLVMLGCDEILEYPGAEYRYDSLANYTYIDDDTHSCYLDIRYINYTDTALPTDQIHLYMDCFGSLD